MFDSEMVSKATKFIIEEFVQDNIHIRLVNEPSHADIFVYPTFLNYSRPDVKFSIGFLSRKIETVFLEMEILFYESKYSFKQTLQCKTSLVKDVRSNFYTVLDDESDFAQSLIFNLIKKSVDECFVNFDKIIF